MADASSLHGRIAEAAENNVTASNVTIEVEATSAIITTHIAVPSGVTVCGVHRAAVRNLPNASAATAALGLPVETILIESSCLLWPLPPPLPPLLMPELNDQSGDSIVTLERGRDIDGALLASTIAGLCLACGFIAFCGVILYARKRFGAGNEKKWLHYKLAHSNPVWPIFYLPSDVREALRNDLYYRTVPMRRQPSWKPDTALPVEIVKGWADIKAAEEVEAAEAAEFQAEADEALEESRLITRLMRQMAANAAAGGGDDGELHVDEPSPQPACVLKPQKKAPPPGRRRRSRQLAHASSRQLAAFFEAKANEKAEAEAEAEARPRRRSHGGKEGEGGSTVGASGRRRHSHQLPVDETEGGGRLGASGRRRHSHQLPVYRLKVEPTATQIGVEGEEDALQAEAGDASAGSTRITAPARQLAAHAAGSGGDDGELHVDEPSPQPARVLKPQQAPPPPHGARLSGPGVLDTHIADVTVFFEAEAKQKAELEGEVRPRRRSHGGEEGEGGGTHAPLCTGRCRRSHQLPVSAAGTAALARARENHGRSGSIPPQSTVDDDGSCADCQTALQPGASTRRSTPVSPAGTAALTRARQSRGDSDNSPPRATPDGDGSSADEYPVEFQRASPRGRNEAGSPTAAIRVRGEQTPRPPQPPPPYDDDTPSVYDEYRI